MAKKNLIVGQSGGPTAVINSSLYGVVSEGLSHPDTIEHVYGMINGIEGFLNDCILDFEEALPGEDLNGLKSTPGAYLGSCRYKLPESLEDRSSKWRAINLPTIVLSWLIASTVVVFSLLLIITRGILLASSSTFF